MGTIENIGEEIERAISANNEIIFQRMQEFMEKAMLQHNGVQNDTNAPEMIEDPNERVFQANQAQAEVEFEATRLYDTLIDPRQRSKKEIEDYGDEVSKLYARPEFVNVHDAFCSDFVYWDTSHFKLMRRSTLSAINQSMIDQGVNLRADGRYSLWRVFGEYIDNLWKSNFAVNPPENTNDAPPGNLSDCETAIPAEPPIAPIKAPVAKSDSTTSTRERKGRPTYVSKLFPRELKYSGDPKEPLRRRFKTFINAVKLCEVDPENVQVMFALFETSFLTKQALLHFQDIIRETARTVEEVIDLLEAHFLGHRARRVNDEIWESLSYEFVKKTRHSRKETTTHEHILADLLEQIADLSDIRTGPGSDTIIMAKTISAVRDVDVYSTVCQNPPSILQDLNSTLRSCALEKDRQDIKNGTMTGEGSENAAKPAFAYKSDVDQLVYYVDRIARDKRRGKNQKGYGRSPSPSRQRIPRNMCIVCGKTGCHSSKHKNRSRRYLNNFFKSYHTTLDDSGSESETEEADQAGKDDSTDSEDSEADSINLMSMISAYRSYAAMGIYPSHPELQMDAALIDTGSSHLSTIGERLVSAAQIASVRKTKPDYSSAKTLRGIGNSRVKTKGTLKFYFLFGGKMYTISLFILDGDDPMIISHKDLDRFGLNYQSYFKVIERMEDSYIQQVEMRNNLPFLVFETTGFFSTKQLRAIHRNLGHPSVERTMKVIETADINGLPSDTKTQLEKIAKHCQACQLNKAKPRRFLFALKAGIMGEFNHILEIDVVKVDDGLVLHVICSGTGFQQGKFLRAMTSADAWKTLRQCWINVYAGAPDYLHADAGTNFVGQEFVEAAENMGMVVKIAPTEGHERIGKVERSHGVLKSVYSKLKIDLPQITKSDRLSLAFRAINDSPNSDSGISPTALVFGVHPKLPGGGNRGSYAQRAKIVSECTKLAIKMKARRIIRDGAKRQNSLNGVDIETVRRLAPGSQVLVYREKKGWVKYTMAKIDGNNVNVVLPSGLISSFGIHNVRPFIENQTATDAETTTISPVLPKGILKKDTPKANGPASRTRSRVKFAPTTMASFFGMKESPTEFLESRLYELNGLQELGCFEIVDASEAKNHRIYNHSFVDKVKDNGTRKSRLCVAAFNDKDHGLFTAAPTVKRISIRFMMCITSSYGFDLATRDVKKAFVMSKTQLRRPVYMRAPKEMRLPKGQLLKVVRTLYGMPESPMHWFKTYGDYHRDELGMKSVAMDPCLWYRKENEKLSAILALQVDDTLFSGNPKFLALEMVKSDEFPNSGRTSVNSEPIRFNGLDITTTKEGTQMDQRKYIEGVLTPGTFRGMPYTKFRSLRQKLAYAAYSSMPDILVYVARLAQFTESMYLKDSVEALRLLKKCILVMKAGPSLNGIKYVTIPSDKMEVVVCIDAAFATNPDKSSQLGVIAMIRNMETCDANIVHYTSSKSKRIAKSVLAAELFAMVDGFDLGFSIKESLERISGKKNVDLTLMTDSLSLYGLTISLAQTTERRLQIDLEVLREAFERREIQNIIWIAGQENPADDLTKPDKRSGKLAHLVDSNKFAPTKISWIDRDLKPVKTSLSK